MNKKGFTYIISAIILVAILFAIIVSNDSHFFRDKQGLNNQRLVYVNDFVKGFNQDCERAIHIASFRTMVALEDQVASTGSFLNNTAESFKETVYNGTINGEPTAIMNSSSINDYLLRVEQISSRLGLQVNVTITNIYLSQSNPWLLDVAADAEVKINDSSNLAYWEYNKTFFTQVPIANLRDPLYSVFTYNRLSNTVRQSNFTNLVGLDNNTDNLTIHVENGYYIASNKSPNFVMRFENNLTPNENGIESIVNINTISDQDITVYPDRIKVDYIYFNNINSSNYTKICEIQNVPESLELVLTQDRTSLYELTGLNYSLTCN